MSWGRVHSLAAWSLLGALLVLPQIAGAQSSVVRAAVLAWDERQLLRLTVAYHDVIDGPIRAKLAGGLPTTIVMRAYVYSGNGDKPISGSVKSCRVIFDLWDEVYKVEIQQLGSNGMLTATPTLDGVLRRCGGVENLPLLAKSSLPPGTESLYVNVLVEVNPISSEMLDRIKRWVSRPSGTSTNAPGDALFGSFVGLFVARIGGSDRQLEFRTPSFVP